MPAGLAKKFASAPANKNYSEESGFNPDSDDPAISSGDDTMAKHSNATSYMDKRGMTNNLVAKANEVSSEPKLDIMGILMSKDPKAAITKMMKLPIKKFFKTGLPTPKLQKLVAVFAFAMGAQLVYSKRSRTMALRLLHKILFGVTLFGLLVLVGLLVLKQKMQDKGHATDAVEAGRPRELTGSPPRPSQTS